MPPARLAPVPGDAPAVERGVGFFETVLLVNGRPVLWKAHVGRLLATVSGFALPCPERDELDAARDQAWTATAPRTRPSAEMALRLTWLAVATDLDDRRSWRLDASIRPIPATTLKRRSGSIAISLPPELTRDSPGCKSTSYMAAVLGLRHAQRHGGDEGLFVATDRSYVEGTATALAAWDEGRLLLSHHAALPSVTAAAFLEGPADSRGVLTRERLRAGAILLGSLTLAAPLLSLDGEPCAQPPAMLERIGRFNLALVEGSRDEAAG